MVILEESLKISDCYQRHAGLLRLPNPAEFSSVPWADILSGVAKRWIHGEDRGNLETVYDVMARVGVLDRWQSAVKSHP